MNSTNTAARPRRVLPAKQPWPLFDVARSRRIEAHALAARPGGALMRQAGASVARLALALAPHARRVWVAAGPGGNGGDGLHAAADLARAGRAVVVTLLAQRAQLSPDARAGLLRAEQAGVQVSATLPERPFDLVIDALLGIGSARAPVGELAAAIALLNGVGARCLAVDLPSGLDADTGMPWGDAVVRADATLSLLTLKPGLFTAAGRDQAGEVWIDTLGSEYGLPEPPVAVLTSVLTWHASSTRRRHGQHKGSFGDVVVIGGAPGMHGAARLAAQGAAAAGAGRTIVSLLDTGATPGDLNHPEWLWRHQAWLPGVAELETSTVVCGCGGGGLVQAVLASVLSRSARLVLDADALNAVAADASLQALLTARATRGRATVITPHPLEAARLLQSTTQAVQAGRLSAANALATRFGVTVVLKGSGTVVVTPGATPAINSTGNAALASGGTGDVLAGWIGGQWSQQAARAGLIEADRAFVSAQASVWLHGLAADRSGRAALRAGALPAAMDNCIPDDSGTP